MSMMSIISITDLFPHTFSVAHSFSELDSWLEHVLNLYLDDKHLNTLYTLNHFAYRKEGPPTKPKPTKTAAVATAAVAAATSSVTAETEAANDENEVQLRKKPTKTEFRRQPRNSLRFSSFLFSFIEHYHLFATWLTTYKKKIAGTHEVYSHLILTNFRFEVLIFYGT